MLDILPALSDYCKQRIYRVDGAENYGGFAFVMDWIGGINFAFNSCFVECLCTAVTFLFWCTCVEGHALS